MISAPAFALVAAALYGAADFFGGLASRRTAAATVVLFSQLAGLALLGLVWPFVPGRFYSADLGWGALAGVCGAVGIAALYAALAVGRMGIVSPITAVVGTSVPVVVGLALGERPGPSALAGVALAFVAVALVSADAQTKRFSLREPGVALALLSGLGIGGLYVFLARGHADAGLGLLLTSRAISIPLLAAFVVLRREPLRPARGTWRLVAAAGALDMGANVLYLLATRFGMLAIVATLTSLYPASTVFLARVVLRERLSGVQWFGVACAGAGVALISL